MRWTTLHQLSLQLASHGQTGGNPPQTKAGFAVFTNGWIAVEIRVCAASDAACSPCLLAPALCQVPRSLPWLDRVSLTFNPHSPAGDIKLRQHNAHCEAESNDMLLYLAGINEHAVLRIVGSKRWSLAHFLRTIHYLFEYGVRFLAT